MPLHRKADPFLTAAQIPGLRPELRDPTSVFNPGAAFWRGRELLLLRVQTRGRTTLLLPAERTEDSVDFLGPPLEIDCGVIEPFHIYDARLSVIEDVLYAVCACDLAESCALLTLRSTDFERWETVVFDTSTDQRNGVLFPEKIDGSFVRLERPNQLALEGGPHTGSAITCSTSDDLVSWERKGIVMEGRPRRWDEWIGSGPPPVKTREGWLHLYHGVATHFASTNIYQAGVVLLDLQEPWKVITRGTFNILEPRSSWELTGQVPNVVFPSGMVVERVDDEGFAESDSPVRVYYGAADTVVGLATSTVAELIEDARFTG